MSQTYYVHIKMRIMCRVNASMSMLSGTSQEDANVNVAFKKLFALFELSDLVCFFYLEERKRSCLSTRIAHIPYDIGKGDDLYFYREG